ncbi:MAG: archease [Deltaproteobacteria bacterium CG07_land_8_20_14_0_80_60_11]|nr:MAG: archease [Deltaproteobacteria bacterium CG07_land_8_20_14_0_80_60_11]
MIKKKPEASPRRRRPYRQLPHTADLAWRLWGASLPELFENAGCALSATLTDRRYLRRRATREVSLEAFDREALLVDWLNHLLYLFDVDGFVGRDFQVVSLTDEHLEARVTGESFDPARHPSLTGVKAATFHQLSIVPAGDGWQATVVLDL